MSLVQANLLKLALRIDPLTDRDNPFQDLNSLIAVSGATNATPIVLSTATPHGINTGDDVYIASVGGNTAANNTTTNPYWIATRVSSTTFSIADKDGNSVAGNGAYTSGGAIVKAMIGASDGQKFKRQQLLDIYNSARFTLFEAIADTYGKSTLKDIISSQVVEHSEVTSTAGVINKPNGYLIPISLIDYNNREIYIKSADYANKIRGGDLPSYIESSTNRFVIDSGTTLTNITGITVMPNSTSTIKYYLTYYGITTYSLTDVLGGSTQESFIDSFVEYILELGVAISSGYGGQELLSLAKSLTGKKSHI